jgi:hypothetical protein
MELQRFTDDTQCVLRAFLTPPPPPAGSIKLDLYMTTPGAFPDSQHMRDHNYCMETVFKGSHARICAHSSRPIDPIGQLPPEIQLEVFALLDYQAMIRLSRVNRHYKAIIDPHSRPLAEKDEFVRTHQKKRKHNLCFIDMIDGDTNIEWRKNGFACYSCHRVLPFTAFSQRQLREYHNKESCKEGEAGSRRRCFKCAISAGLYRSRTLITKAKTMFRFKDKVGGKPQFQDTVQYFYCTSCSDFIKYNLDNKIRFCQKCGDRSRHCRRHNLTLLDGRPVLDCRQCGFFTQLEPGKGCVYCRGPICAQCGCATETGNWWCGRACSRDGFDFCYRAGCCWEPFKPKLWDIMQGKIETRKMECNPDLVDRSESDDNILGPLFEPDFGGSSR